jgi:hypothetical protein
MPLAGCPAALLLVAREGRRDMRAREFVIAMPPEDFENPIAYLRVMLTPNSTPDVAVSK